MRWVTAPAPAYLGGYATTWGTLGIDMLESPLKLTDPPEQMLYSCPAAASQINNVTGFNHGPAGFARVDAFYTDPSVIGCQGTTVGRLDGSTKFESSLKAYRSNSNPSGKFFLP